MTSNMKTASGAPTLPMLVVGGNKPPHTYLGVARSLVPGAVLLANSPDTSPHAFALVSAHALECMLKAYLTRSGDDKAARAVTKPDIRHNLEMLWREAVIDGLQIDEDPPKWVLRLSGLHDSPYHLRYSTGINGIVLPPTHQTRSGLLQVMQAVESSL